MMTPATAAHPASNSTIILFFPFSGWRNAPIRLLNLLFRLLRAGIKAGNYTFTAANQYYFNSAHSA